MKSLAWSSTTEVANPAFQSMKPTMLPARTRPSLSSDKFTRHVVAHVDRRLARHSFLRQRHRERDGSARGRPLRIPRLNWVFRAFYGRYYQPPPLVTITGPCSFDLAAPATVTLLAASRRARRRASVRRDDSVSRLGLDIDNFETRGRISSTTTTSANPNLHSGHHRRIPNSRHRSSRCARRASGIAAQVHLAYSNQIAQAQGALPAA